MKWSIFEKYQVCLISSLKSSRRYRNYSIIYLKSVSLSCAHVRPYKSAAESLENYSLNHVKFNLVATLAPIQSRRCNGMQQEIAIFSSKVQFEYIVSKVAHTSVHTFLHSFAKQLYNLISYTIETKEKAPMKKEHAHTEREESEEKLMLFLFCWKTVYLITDRKFQNIHFRWRRAIAQISVVFWPTLIAFNFMVIGFMQHKRTNSKWLKQCNVMNVCVYVLFCIKWNLCKRGNIVAV